jgi:two-component system chemotaxis sensor kinase CheA
MSTLLHQFILEGREFLEDISRRLIEMEERPQDADLVKDLFRMVHTLKGNSGLFDFAPMTRLLHASEDLMDAVRDGRAPYSRALADRLLDAMDLVGCMLDEVQGTQSLGGSQGARAEALALQLRELMGHADEQRLPGLQTEPVGRPAEGSAPAPAPSRNGTATQALWELRMIPEQALMQAFKLARRDAAPLHALRYSPEEQCFFKGEDPFRLARTMPGAVWGLAAWREPAVAQGPTFDCYRCIMDFEVLCAGPLVPLLDHFRYVPEQVFTQALQATDLILLRGGDCDPSACAEFAEHAGPLLRAGDLATLRTSAASMAELVAPESWLGCALRWLLLLSEDGLGAPGELEALLLAISSQSVPQWPGPGVLAEAPAPAALSSHARDILRTQQEILALPDDVPWLRGRLAACAGVLGRFSADSEGLQRALHEAQQAGNASALRAWARQADRLAEALVDDAAKVKELGAAEPAAAPREAMPAAGVEVRTSARGDEGASSKVLKVEQGKVDYLMDLIGEMVVAKNALPYLADRAERQGSGPALAREIKAQYAVINRIAEEMQDAIMQVRMMPVSVIFQRFPRLIRDIAHKLGKEVTLQLEGEQTEADKNVVEALADPLIHLVRNSLDHGVEAPEERQAAGKPRAGVVRIAATQESDRVIIEVTDDGRGIDPEHIKRKAYAQGLIDDAALDRITDREAVNLVFAAGFSTSEEVSDLSGRGVGMDVVRSAMNRIGGGVDLRSTVGQGSVVRLSLPLSMAVSHVMVIESDGQIFGVPMEAVEETVRVATSRLRRIKSRLTTVLRDRIVPLYALNDLLGLQTPPRLNADHEHAALILRLAESTVGLLIDGFRGVSDVILKPLPGHLGKLRLYAGSALLGDGTVLMVLNPKEMFR